MKLQSINLNQNYKIQKNKNTQTRPNNIDPAKTPTNNKLACYPSGYYLNFGAMKKSQFTGLDLFVVNKFKAPISKFNSDEDLQNWADKTIKTLLNETQLDGRWEETREEREKTIEEWTNYVQKENDAYTKTIQLLVLDSILKETNENNDTIPPALNKGVLADTLAQILDAVSANKNYQCNFNKLYQNNLKNFYLDKTNGDEKPEDLKDFTGWIEIKSKINDEKNFEDNVNKLKTLSHPAWCTKSFNARPYLEKGDFHVFYENGKPKLGVRFIGDRIEEVQGEKNDSIIPFEYYNTFLAYARENNLKPSKNLKTEMQNTKEKFEAIKTAKKELKEAIQNKDYETILKHFGFNVEFDENDLMILDEYKKPAKSFNLADIGVNEDDLFKNIVRIKGDANFSGTAVRNTGNLKHIEGSVVLANSKIQAMPRLISAYNKQKTGYNDANSDLHYSLKEENLKTIANELKDAVENKDYAAILRYFDINFEYDEDGLMVLDEFYEPWGFRYSEIGVNVEDLLKNVSEIKGEFYFLTDRIKNIGSIKNIGGEIKDYSASELYISKKVSENKKEGIELIAKNSGYFIDSDENGITVKKFDKKLEKALIEYGIEPDEIFEHITRIDGNADFRESKITDIKGLTYIKGDVDIRKSNLKNSDFIDVEFGEEEE